MTKHVQIKRVLLIPFLIISFYSTSFAQNANVASGGEATGSGGTSSYSIGQVFHQYSESSSGSVSVGVQQPYEIWVTDIDQNPEIELSYTAYPNPTLGALWLKIGNYNQQQMKGLLFDMNGKEILVNEIKTAETQINLQDFAVGVYFLRLFEQDELLKTFKIIKN